jgi:hypothetical protein
MKQKVRDMIVPERSLGHIDSNADDDDDDDDTDEMDDDEAAELRKFYGVM